MFFKDINSATPPYKDWHCHLCMEEGYLNYAYSLFNPKSVNVFNLRQLNSPVAPRKKRELMIVL